MVPHLTTGVLIRWGLWMQRQTPTERRWWRGRLEKPIYKTPRISATLPSASLRLEAKSHSPLQPPGSAACRHLDGASGLRQHFLLFKATHRGWGALSCCPRKATRPPSPNRICPEVFGTGRKDAGLPNSEITSPFSERAIHSPAELGIRCEALILILSLWICTHTGTVHG